MRELSIEAIQAIAPGADLGASEWVLVDQAMIDRFADATGDHQFIHVDPDKARMTPFGGTVAHGFLTLSILPMLAERSDMPRPAAKIGLNYGLNKVRFLSPVRSGSRVRAIFRQVEFVEKRPGQHQHTIAATVEIEGQEKPAMLAEWIFQIFG